MERIPDQTGFLILTMDGAVISVSVYSSKIAYYYKHT